MKIENVIKSLNPSKLHLALFIGLVAVILLLSYIYKQHNQITQGEQTIKALSDTVTVYKTKEGKNAATIRIIQAESRKQALLIAKTRNPDIYKQLQENKSITSITQFSTITRIDTVVKVNNIRTPADSNIVFSRKIHNQYYDAQVAMKNDSLALGIQVYNKFTIRAEEKPDGFLKPKKYVINVINDNPYTITDSLATYEIRPKVRGRFWKIAVPVALGVAGTLLIK